MVFLGTTSLVYDGRNDKIGEYQLDCNHKVFLFITSRLAYEENMVFGGRWCKDNSILETRNEKESW